MAPPHEPLSSASTRDHSRSNASRRVAVGITAAVLAGVVFGVPAIADRGDDQGPAAELIPDAAPQPDTDAQPTPWIEPTEIPAPEPDPVDETPDPDEARRLLVAQCEVEHGTMTAVALAFVTQTRSVPDDLDVVESTWLREVPDGWNDDWTFQIVDDGLTVVPTPGRPCDL